MNPPIPENSKYFRRRSGDSFDSVEIPGMGWQPLLLFAQAARNPKKDGVTRNLAEWLPWIAAMAVAEIRKEIMAAASSASACAREDMDESAIDAFQEWATQKNRDAFAWRAWVQP